MSYDDIIDGTINEINNLKIKRGSPLQLASGIRNAYSSFEYEMKKRGCNDNIIHFSWEYIAEVCNLTDIRKEVMNDEADGC
ncbi:hypothetical protein [Eubacterium sp.]|uniref:hypothetical protein n=1 Tax=Eubacterium sp. TaxID=142586 RepID=UPI0025853309|nr:hypothetical protein [Eubacterium sp.]MCR5368386.1 hypothetical protein [Eubacterium sp.]